MNNSGAQARRLQIPIPARVTQAQSSQAGSHPQPLTHHLGMLRSCGLPYLCPWPSWNCLCTHYGPRNGTHPSGSKAELCQVMVKNRVGQLNDQQTQESQLLHLLMGLIALTALMASKAQPFQVCPCPLVVASSTPCITEKHVMSYLY